LSKINYGSIIYNSASDAEKNRLQVMQNKALKIVTGAFPSANTEKLHVETNTLKLDLQREKRALKYWARTIGQWDKLPINDKIGKSLYFI
jgi:hypothetical protein